MLIVIGIVFDLIGIALIAAYSLSVVRCKTPLTAKVVKVKKKTIFWRGKNINEYTPIISYEFNDKKYSGAADVSVRDKNAYSKGQEVQIFIDEKKPKNFRISKNLSFLFGGIAAFIIGIVLTVCFFL